MQYCDTSIIDNIVKKKGTGVKTSSAMKSSQIKKKIILTKEICTNGSGLVIVEFYFISYYNGFFKTIFDTRVLQSVYYSFYLL